MTVLQAVCEAASYPWSVRLKALLPLWMSWVRKRFRVSAGVERQPFAISARQIDRRLRERNRRLKRRRYGGIRPGALLKHPIPVKTDAWEVHVRGFIDLDLVSHSATIGNRPSAQRERAVASAQLNLTMGLPCARLLKIID